MSDEVHSTTQTKRATEAKSRENAKKVKTYHAADWGITMCLGLTLKALRYMDQ